jgi:predicted  nucleic acid-binding Zn-ribbon protein
MDDLEAAIDRINQLGQQVTDLEWELHGIKIESINETGALNSEITTLTNIVESSRNLLKEAESTINDLEYEVESLKEDVDGKDFKIRCLEKDVNRLEYGY